MIVNVSAGSIEGEVVPFPMTQEQRRIACEKLAGGPSRQTPEYDGVQLFRANKPVLTIEGVPISGMKTYKCAACGSTVKAPKKPKVKALPPRKQKWWLYYGPNRLSGGFPTKEEAMNWYLRGGR